MEVIVGAFVLVKSAFQEFRNFQAVKTTLPKSYNTSEQNINDINKMIRKLGPVTAFDTLPLVQTTGLEPPPDATVVVDCASSPLKIAGDANVDCTALCLDNDAELFNVTANDVVVSPDGTLLPEGKYCTSSSLVPCMPGFGALILSSRGVSTCKPFYPLVVGGPNANTMIAGQVPGARPEENAKNGMVLHDDDDPYEIDTTKPVPNFYDTAKPYKIKCGGRSRNNVALFAAPGTTLCLEDYCGNGVPYSAARLDNNGHCICPDGLVNEDPDDPTTPCVVKPTAYDEATYTISLNVPCFTPNSPIVDRQIFTQPCLDLQNPAKSMTSTNKAKAIPKATNVRTIPKYAFNENWTKSSVTS